MTKGLQVFFSLIPSFSITDRSQTRVGRALDSAQDAVRRQPALQAWATEHGVDGLRITLVYDGARQRPLVVKAGPSWAGHSIEVRNFRESWVEAPMTDEQAAAWVAQAVNEALAVVSREQHLPESLRVPEPASPLFRFVRVEVRGAVAAPGKRMSTNPALEAWLRSARLVCDTLNDQLGTTVLTSTSRAELEISAAARARSRRASPGGRETTNPDDLVGPDAGFASLPIPDRAMFVLGQLHRQVQGWAGCDAEAVAAVFAEVETRLRAHQWTFETISRWVDSPEGHREARWVYRVSPVDEAVMKVEVRDKPDGPVVASDWSPAGPTAKAVETIAWAGLNWESETTVEFLHPHLMDSRRRPIHIDLDPLAPPEPATTAQPTTTTLPQKPPPTPTGNKDADRDPTAVTTSLARKGPRFRNLHFFPYSGWHTQPWGRPDTSSRDVDAAARTARRVTEEISRQLADRKPHSPVSSYRLFLEEGPDEDLRLILSSHGRDPFLGRLQIPPGFRYLSPEVRAGLIADTSQAALLALAATANWDPQIVLDAVREAREADFACRWVGPWKSTRDRKSHVRLEGRILDDGYGRWQIVVADRASVEERLKTEEVVGWTWLANLEHTAKSMRFTTSTVLELASGSNALPTPTQVDIVTGKTHSHSRDPEPTRYPGEPDRAPRTPRLAVQGR